MNRKIAAILAADIAGYSRLMGLDEAGTLARLKACRAVMDRLIAGHRGRIFNTAGDSVVADFASAVDAAQCAVAVQEAPGKENADVAKAEAMHFRIGIHVGDVIVEGQTCLTTRSTSPQARGSRRARRDLRVGDGARPDRHRAAHCL